MILASDGSLWAWGKHRWLAGAGRNTTNQTSLHRIGSDTNWLSIAVRMHHNLAVKSDGTLWGCWGNIYGQLGDDRSLTHPNHSSIPVIAAQVMIGSKPLSEARTVSP